MKNETAVPSLVAAIAALSAKVRRFDGKPLGEQNTKATLIEPMLEALGWDIRDPDEVYREFKPTTKDCPVDYALQLLRKPRLFVEAKGLHENLSDRKWIAQVLGYATVAGVSRASRWSYRFAAMLGSLANAASASREARGSCAPISAFVRPLISEFCLLTATACAVGAHEYALNKRLIRACLAGGMSYDTSCRATA